MAQTKKKRKLGRWLVIAAVALFLYFVFTGNNGVLNIIRLKNRQDALKSDIVSLQGKVDSLKAEVQRLKTDTTYIEQIAREKFGMARKNETVYKFSNKED